MTDPLPERLLQGVSWSFRKPRYANLAAFTKALEAYHREATPDVALDPAARVLAADKVEVAHGRGAHVLRSPGGFTAAGLLFQLHNALRAELAKDEHHHLRDLKLEPDPGRAPGFGPPRYRLRTRAWLGTRAEQPRGPLPSEAMRDVYWSFAGKHASERAAFLEEVTAYNLEIGQGRSAWSPEALALPAPVVRIGYMRWKGDAQVDEEVTLRSERPEGFTMGDLLFQLHRHAAPHLAGQDHHFFEGLSQFPGTDPAEPPLYHLLLGS